MTRLRWTLTALLGLSLLRLPVAWLMARLLPDVSVAPEWNYAAAMLQSAVMFALPGFLLMRKDKRPVCLDGQLLRWAALTAAAAILARAALTPLNAWWGSLVGQSRTAIPEARGLWDGLLRVLALAVVPAAAEELFFRGALLQSLKAECGSGTACAFTTLVFAMMHGSLAGLPGHLIISLLLTLAALCSGSLAAPIAGHLVYNLTALVWPQTAAFVPWICGSVLAAMLAWLLLRMPRTKERRMRWAEALLCGAVMGIMAVQYLIFA